MPRLLIIRELRHEFHEILTPSVTLGCADSCTIPLDDPTVEPCHCQIREQGGTYFVCDMGSESGTLLNSVQVKEGELRPGDRVEIGETKVYFLAGGGPAPRGSGLLRRLGVRLGEPRATSSVPEERFVQLLLLQDINKALNSELHLERLLDCIMDSAINLCSAERGYLVLLGDDDRYHFAVARNISHAEVERPEFGVSRSVIQQVIRQGTPILTSNAQADLAQYESIASQPVHALLCAPLRAKGRIIGTIYLDSRIPQSRFGPDALDLLTAFGDQAAIAIENARLLREVRKKERMEYELSLGREIQRRLLPREDPEIEGIEVHGRQETAVEVGGDFFDFVRSRDGECMYICIGDVSGKGVPAGLCMVMTRYVFRPLLAAGVSTKAALVEANRSLFEELDPSMFVTMTLLRWSEKKQSLLFTGAGHERLLIYRRRRGRCSAVPAGGIVLGALEDISEHLVEREVALQPGDTIILYTDGITEAMNAKREEFGLARLMKVIDSHGRLPLRKLTDRILDEIHGFVGDAEPHDDITLVAIRKRGTGS